MRTQPDCLMGFRIMLKLILPSSEIFITIQGHFGAKSREVVYTLS